MTNNRCIVRKKREKKNKKKTHTHRGCLTDTVEQGDRGQRLWPTVFAPLQERASLWPSPSSPDLRRWPRTTGPSKSPWTDRGNHAVSSRTRTQTHAHMLFIYLIWFVVVVVVEMHCRKTESLFLKKHGGFTEVILMWKKTNSWDTSLETRIIFLREFF